MSEVKKYYKTFYFSWRKLVKVSFFVFFLYFMWFLVESLKNSFPIREVKIAGVFHEQQEVQKSLLPLVNKGFFKIDVSQIRDRLRLFPWINEASVRRVWPNQVIIQVKEKKAIARWNDVGLITHSGEIFNPSNKAAYLDLPIFNGPEGEHVQMLAHYMNISSILEPLHFKIAQLTLSPEHSLSLTLTNGIKLNAGYKDILTRMDHFVKVYPKLIGNRADEVEYVDLRYKNGMAVRWKV